MAKTSGRARQLLWTFHRWIGLLLLTLLVPISLSGALLVFDDVLDALVHPSRYAVSGNATLAPSVYLAHAKAALDAGLEPAVVRYPGDDGRPVMVQARGGGRDGGPPRILIVYLDPPTARVLGVADFRSSLIGVLHRFHENLTIPEYSGRAIVGWAGVAMLVLALSGIVLWWPRNGALLPGLRWRRAPGTSGNLHHSFGFWISMPLAFVSLTGVYLAFPPQARSLLSSVAPMAPQGPRGFAPPLRRTSIAPDQALAAARALAADAAPIALFLPTASRDGAAGTPTWRIQSRDRAGDDLTLLVDDGTAEASLRPAPLSGDRAAQWIRWLHEGSHSGMVWRVVVLLTGLFPAVLAVTGLMMWLRGWPKRKLRSPAMDGGELQAAE
jgi:uncharacterized iron-regulated membrane protein